MGKLMGKSRRPNGVGSHEGSHEGCLVGSLVGSFGRES